MAAYEESESGWKIQEEKKKSIKQAVSSASCAACGVLSFCVYSGDYFEVG